MKKILSTQRFERVDDYYHNTIIPEITNTQPIDLLHHPGAYLGLVTIAKYQCITDCYMRVRHLSGNCADVGTWMGSTFLYVAKLVKLWEPYSYSCCHAFDWFRGMDIATGPDCHKSWNGTCKGSYENLIHLTTLQKLDDVAIIHKLDLIAESEKFFDDNPHMRFKLIYFDCGAKEVLETAMPLFWERLVPCGIMMLDHYGLEPSPYEADIVDEITGGAIIHQYPIARQPSGYVIKGEGGAAKKKEREAP